MTMPACPSCGDNREVYEDGERHFWCRWCNVEFDPEDDGTIGYGQPDQNAIRREERALRERQRRQQPRRGR